MTDEQRFEEIREEIRRRAMTVEENTLDPSQPTAVGWIVALWDEVTALRIRVDDLEREEA